MPNLDLDETRAELSWLNEKLVLKTMVQSGQSRPTKRGQVFGCAFGYNLGSEMRGSHPCVIVQSDSFSPFGYTTYVAPITHATNRTSIPHWLIDVGCIKDVKGNLLVEGYADISAIRCISKVRLTKPKCVLPSDVMDKIDEKVASSFGIFHYYADLKHKLETVQNQNTNMTEKIKMLRAALISIASLPDDEKEKIKGIITEALKL